MGILSDPARIAAMAEHRRVEVGAMKMARQPPLIRQADASRIFAAARKAGYSRTTLIRRPDGQIEFVCEEAEVKAADANISPFEQWKQGNARKD